MEYGQGRTVEKPGLIATEANACITLQLTNIHKAVRMINIQRIKSYGEKWRESKAQFTVLVENQKKTPYTAQFDVDGYHNAQKR
jgi:16S rRNA C1402 (ribose-2'-O) methylase RsmI